VVVVMLSVCCIPIHTIISYLCGLEIHFYLAKDCKSFAAGQLVYEKEMNAGDYSIPVSSFNAGVYFLQLKTNSGVFTERVVKLN
jgi:hypothetical protein